MFFYTNISMREGVANPLSCFSLNAKEKSVVLNLIEKKLLGITHQLIKWVRRNNKGTLEALFLVVVSRPSLKKKNHLTTTTSFSSCFHPKVEAKEKFSHNLIPSSSSFSTLTLPRIN